MQISDYLYVDKVFQNLRQKLCLRSCVLDEKTNLLIWELFIGPSYNEILMAYVVRHYSKVDLGTNIRDPECIYYDV